jgi:hypothetical protein
MYCWGTVLWSTFVLLLVTPAQAPGGWYLMRPPEDPKPSAGRSTVPLRDWDTSQSFDSASECERSRALVLQLADQDLRGRRQQLIETKKQREVLASDPRLLDFIQGLVRNAEVGREQAAAARCVASDDPRLTSPAAGSGSQRGIR